jgi:Rrf2 family nitric oxide-sensitive transcriptional repressor
MQLTKFTDYSLRILMYVSEHSARLCTINEIAEWYGISKPHLVKVVHNLVKLGYLKSVRGKGGGLRLNKTAQEINIGELIRDIEVNFNIAECFNKQSNSCRITGTCKLKHVLHEAVEQFFKVLDKYTLETIGFNAHTDQNKSE